MSQNKRIVEKYMEGFNELNHEKILSCLTEDVVWDLPGIFHLEGKGAFDKEIENPAFVGRPIVKVTRLIEENDIVVAEGRVRAKKADGGLLNAVFCDVFSFREGKVHQLTSYLQEVKENR